MTMGTDLDTAPAAGSVALPASRLRHAAIAGVGAYVPEGTITNADLEQMVDTSDTWIMERTGIRSRHRIGSGETSAQMGAKAARQAMAMAGVETVDLIICATASPDTLVPATACLIQRELGLFGMPAFDINAACSGYVYAMHVADSLVCSGAAATVLVVATEALTRLVDYADRSTCILFGDGAGASVVVASEKAGIRAARWGADGSQASMIYYGPAQEAQDDLRDGVRMAGRDTFKLAVDRLSSMTKGLIAACNWDVNEVNHFIPHQANIRIIEAAAKRLGVSMERVIVNIEHTGNTSSASIPLAMAEAHAKGLLKAGDRIVCVAFGAGVTWGGLALEWSAGK